MDFIPMIAWMEEVLGTENNVWRWSNMLESIEFFYEEDALAFKIKFGL